MLHNELYIGNHLWNRTSKKLGKVKVRNEPDDWIRMDGVFRPIVDRELFQKVQDRFASYKAPRTKDEMLDDLRRILGEHGRLSSNLVDKDKRSMSTERYLERFGGLLKAYNEIGYFPDRSNSKFRLASIVRKFRDEAFAEAIQGIRNTGFAAKRDRHGASAVIHSNLEIQFSPLRCFQLEAGYLRWRYHLYVRPTVDIVVAIRMEMGNQKIQDYHLLPVRDIPTQFYWSEKNPDRYREFRCHTLKPLYSLFEQTNVEGVPLRDRIVSAIDEAGH